MNWDNFYEVHGMMELIKNFRIKNEANELNLKKKKKNKQRGLTFLFQE